MPNAPQIFDADLLFRHHARAASPLFLNAEFEKELIDRLQDVRRDFPAAALLGDDAMAPTLRDHSKISTLTHLSHNDLAQGTISLPSQSMDLVISAWHLASLNDVPGYLIQIQKILKPDGWLLALFYGGESLVELRQTFWQADEEIFGGVHPRVAPMIDLRDAAGLLQRTQFALPVADHHIVTIHYDNLFKIMQELRQSGLQNALTERRKSFTPKKYFMRAAEIYQEKFGLTDGKIPVTAEVISLSAWAPAASQQQALLPGSATQRLADALQATEYKL
jgi:hypothetical protein